MSTSTNLNKINSLKNKYKKKLKIKFIESKIRSSKFKKNFKFFLLMNWTWPKKVFLAISIIILIGAIFLYLPISYNLDSYSYINNHYVFNFKELENNFLNQEFKNVEFNFVDALYYSISAFTTTGLNGKIDIGTQMSFFGQFVIFVLLQVGGFGYASLFYLLGRFLHKITKKSFFSASLSHIERGGTKISESSKMIVKIFFTICFIQLFFGIILFFILYFVPFKDQQNLQFLSGFTVDSNEIYDCYHNFGQSLWKGIFLSSSAINNAGFDLFGVSSLSLFRNDLGILVQFIVIILFLIGGIGYPVIYDLTIRIQWIFKYKFLFKMCKVQKYGYLKKEKFSSFSKICLATSLIVIVFSVFLTFTTEFVSQFQHNIDDWKKFEQNYSNGIKQVIPMWMFWNSDFLNKNWIGEFDNQNHFVYGVNKSFNFYFSIFFNTLSTRSAGFSTIGINSLSEITKWVFIFLMFIGASPSSTGGGIRTTTIVVMFKSTNSWLHGTSKTSLFKRNIPTKDIISAFLIFTFGFVFVIVMSGLLYGLALIKINGNNLMTQTPADGVNLTLTDFMFEAFSAFGTCGLSAGVMSSPYVKWWTRIPIIFLMFVGQLGIGQTLEIFARKVPKKQNTNYIEQSIRLG